jgi:hypothetical protein
MDVVIPIENGDLSELLFDHKEKLPDSFYLNIMNMLKVYHAGGQNENDIYAELVDNIDKIDPTVMKLIMTKFLHMLKKQIVIIQKRPMWPTYTLTAIALMFLLLEKVCIKLP